MAKCLKIPAPTGVFVFDLTEALQDGLGGFFVFCLSLFVFRGELVVLRLSFFVDGFWVLSFVCWCMSSIFM